MKYILLTALLLALPLSAAAAGSDLPAECTTAYDIPVDVTPRFDEPAYDLSRDIREIQSMAANNKHRISESLTLGLTQYEPTLSVSMPVKGIKMSNGLICGHVDHVDVTLGYKGVVILIAREIAQNSCGFNEIMAHEMKHIAVNRRILEAYMPRVEAAVQEYMRNYGAFRNEDEENVMAMLREGVHDLIERQMAELERDSQILQQEVDTPEEYKRITRSCNGELGDLTLKYLNDR